MIALAAASAGQASSGIGLGVILGVLGISLMIKSKKPWQK